jgi:CubicO group peptidase (beta-lactamase class C family)
VRSLIGLQVLILMTEMLKFLKILSVTILGIAVLACLAGQFALYYSGQIDLEESVNNSQCTSVIDSTYFSQIRRSRLILKSMMEICELPGLSVAISKNGKLIWSEAYGYSDLESKSPACPGSIFRIGSVSKSLTAAALLRLAELKKLNLHQDIRIILPEYPDKDFAITPFHLATHRAGVRPYLDDSEALNTQHFNSAIASLDRFKNDPLVFEPGSNFEYSNYGYVLLSAVMEKVDEKNFLSIMDDEVFTPLKMTSTIPELNDSTNNNICTFYDNETPYSLDGQIHESPFIDHSNKWASGGFLSTAEDLVKFSDALESNFLSRKSVDLMFQPHSSQLILHYGMGWMIARDPYFRKAYFHFGAGSGATSVVVKFPDYDTDIVILSNLGHAKFPYNHLMGVINEFLPQPVFWLLYFIDFLVIGFLIFKIRKKFFSPKAK